MRRLVIPAMLMAALGQTASADSASRTFFLRASDASCGRGDRYLSTIDGVDGSRGSAPGCGTRIVSATELGYCDENSCLAPAPNTGPYSFDWIAADGLPLRLDGSRPAVASLTFDNGGGHAKGMRWAPVTVGELRITVVLEASGVELGRGTTTVLARPGLANHVEVSIPVSPAAAPIESLRVVTVISGYAAGDVFIELERDPSFVTLPLAT